MEVLKVLKVDYCKFAFRRTQHFGARLRATFLSCTFFCKMGHVLNDFRLDVLRQRVLLNASLLYPSVVTVGSFIRSHSWPGASLS